MKHLCKCGAKFSNSPRLIEHVGLLNSSWPKTSPEDEHGRTNILTIAAEYAPYNLYPAFQKGFDAYNAGRISNPHGDTADGQAWDRGAECAMRVKRRFRL